MPRRGRRVAAPAVLLLVLVAAAVAIVVAVSGPAAGAGSRVAAAAVVSHGGPVECVPPHLNVSAALAGGRLTVSPEPESRDASASTQISLLGPPAAEIQDVVVRGSHTGVHAGRLEAFSQGDGASFVPSRPFAEGETVSVSASLELGQPGGTVPVSWSFTVASRDVPGAGVGSATPVLGVASGQSFVSRPELRPPVVTVSSTGRRGTCSSPPTPGPVSSGP